MQIKMSKFVETYWKLHAVDAIHIVFDGSSTHNNIQISNTGVTAKLNK